MAARCGTSHEADHEARAAMEIMALTDAAGVVAAAPLPGVLVELRRRKPGVASGAMLDLPAAEIVRAAGGLDSQGRAKPADCPAFGRECTPQTPLGATMVSGEGACAAWFRYGRKASS